MPSFLCWLILVSFFFNVCPFFSSSFLLLLLLFFLGKPSIIANSTVLGQDRSASPAWRDYRVVKREVRRLLLASSRPPPKPGFFFFFFSPFFLICIDYLFLWCHELTGLQSRLNGWRAICWKARTRLRTIVPQAALPHRWNRMHDGCVPGCSNDFILQGTCSSTRAPPVPLTLILTALLLCCRSASCHTPHATPPPPGNLKQDDTIATITFFILLFFCNVKRDVSCSSSSSL